MAVPTAEPAAAPVIPPPAAKLTPEAAPAERPAYSVLDKSKIKTAFGGVEVKDWILSLKLNK